MEITQPSNRFADDWQSGMYSYDYTPKNQLDQAPILSLAQEMNGAFALEARSRFLNKQYDLTEFGDTPFSRDNYVSYLKKTTDYSPEVVSKALGLPAKSWNEAKRNVEYLTQIEKRRQDVAANYTTGERFLYGAPFAIADPTDIPFVAPVLGAAKLGYKALSKSYKLTAAGKVAYATTSGAAAGAASMMAYETATGVYEENTLLPAALFGGGLGLSFGFIMEKGSQLAGTYIDKQGRRLSEREAKAEELAKAQEKLNELSAVNAEVRQAEKDLRQAQKDLTVSEKNDRGAARDSARKAINTLNEKRQRLTNLIGKVNEDLKPVVLEKGRLEKLIKTLQTNIINLERDTAAATQIKALRADLQKQLSPIKGQITKISKELEAIKNLRTKEANARRTALKEKLAGRQAQAEELNVQIKGADDASAALPTYKEDALAQMQKELNLHNYNLSKVEKAIERLRKEREDYTNQRIPLKEQIDATTMTQAAKDNPYTSGLTDVLKARIEALGEKVSPEGIANLLNRQASLQDVTAKLQAGEWNPSLLKETTLAQETVVDRLQKEMDEITRLTDFRVHPSFKKLPDFMQKLVISPIERNLASLNNEIASFSAMFHSGTLHHGTSMTNTAWMIKVMLGNELKRMHSALTYNYSKAVEAGYTGNQRAFEREVGNNIYAINDAFQREVYGRFAGDVPAEKRLEIAKERAGSTTRKYASDNEWINKAADDVLNYYEYKFNYGKDLGMESFVNAIGKGYINRVLSTEKIAAMGGEDAAIKYLVDAQLNKANDMGVKITDEIIKDFEEQAKALVVATVDKKAQIEQLIQPLGMPKGYGTSSFKQRTIDVYDGDIIKLLDDDIRSVSYMYGFKTDGWMALKQRFGVNNLEEMEGLFKQLGADRPIRGKSQSDKMTTEELDNLRVMTQTILGHRELNRSPLNLFTRATKLASSYSSAMHQLAFGVSTITEISAVASQFGWTKTIDNFVGNIGDVYRIYKYGTPSEKNTIKMMISYGDAQFTYSANRFSEESYLDSVGNAQGLLDSINARFSVYSGMLPITDMLRMTTASLSVDFMARLSVANKISDTDLMRLQDMGFDLNDLERIRTTLKVDSAGNITNFDRKSWGDLNEEITRGVETMVERTILHPNGITLPKFMTDMNEGQFISRVMFKFMRFPIESYERLLLRGYQELDAKQLTAMAGNIAMWSLILAAKDAARDPENQRYGGEEGMKQLGIDSFLYNSVTSAPIAGIDIMSGLLTGKTATGGYPYSVMSSIGSDALRLREGKPAISIPFGRLELNIKDGINSAVQTMTGLEEVNNDE